MPCRLPWAVALTLPVPVILKRFLAPLLVFNLGILLAPYRSRGANGLSLVIKSMKTRNGMPRRAAQVRVIVEKQAVTQRLSAFRHCHAKRLGQWKPINS